MKFKEKIVKSRLNPRERTILYNPRRMWRASPNLYEDSPRWGVEKKKLQNLIEELGDDLLMIDLIVDAGYVNEMKLMHVNKLKDLN